MENALLSSIELGIKELIDAYKANPYDFYSESDLHSALYHILTTKAVDQPCTTRLGRAKPWSKLLHREYPTKSRYKRNKKGPSLKKQRGIRGHFDLSIWDSRVSHKRQFKAPGGKNEQRTLAAIEMSLNEHHSYFEWHVYWDLLKLSDPKNEVDKGYILFFVRDYPYEKTGFQEDGFLSKLKDMFGQEKKVHIMYIESKGSDTKIAQISSTHPFY